MQVCSVTTWKPCSLQCNTGASIPPCLPWRQHLTPGRVSRRTWLASHANDGKDLRKALEPDNNDDRAGAGTTGRQHAVESRKHQNEHDTTLVKPEERSPSVQPSSTQAEVHNGTSHQTQHTRAHGSGTGNADNSGKSSKKGRWRERLQTRLDELQDLLVSSWRSLGSVLDRWWIKFAVVAGFVLAIISVVVNFALVPLVNYELLPSWQASASTATRRKVQFGRVHWVSLGGVTGVVPLLQLGPTSVGPGPYEKSSLVAPHGVAIFIDPLASVLQRQVVLNLALEGPQATIVQGAGSSWFGYPDDTTPSSRDFLPGLPKTETKQPTHSNKTRLPAGAARTASTAPKSDTEPESLPPVALGRVNVRNANLALLVQAERVPRYLQYVNGVLQLGQAYRSVELHLEGVAHVRHVSSNKCTLVNKHAKRHLRHVTPGAANPPPVMYGCDVLPLPVRNVLRTTDNENNVPRPDNSNGSGGNKQQQHSNQPQQVKDPDNVEQQRHQQTGGVKQTATPGASTQQPLASVQSHKQGTVQGTEPSTAHHDSDDPDGTQQQGSESNEQQSAPIPSAYMHRIHRRKKGRQADAARAAGQSLDYTVTAYSAVLQPADAAVAVQAAADHALAVATGNPHVWHSAPWNQSRHKPPTGGRLEIHLTASHINTPDMWPDMTAVIKAEDLHAPLAERLLELPMDVTAGHITGELRIRTFDQKTWQFPEITGRVACKDVSLHFWDAPDDIAGMGIELVFERDRVYLHGAHGWFGAVPLSLTGDLDLNPETGSYRLSASVSPGVEVNALRATLGIRPLPQAVAGALRGIMHCTGPLEQPVFSGSAVALRLPPAAYAGTEASFAKTALLSTPAAVAAFDKVPILSASAVFTLDTSTQRFTLHSAQGMPLGGGQVSGQGSMWVAPEAETNPAAISIQGEGVGLDTGSLLSCYLSPGLKEQLPAGTLASLGAARVRGSMTGPHTGPEVLIGAELPRDSRLLANVSAAFSPSAIALAARGPAMHIDTTVLVSSPHQARLRNADTQAEASFWARPRFEGVDMFASLNGLDLLPLARTATSPALDPVSIGQPLHARCSGNLRLSLRPVRPTTGGQEASPPVKGGGSSSQQPSSVPRKPGPATSSWSDLQASNPSLMFTGPISMSNLKLNSLGMIRQVSGNCGITGLGKLLVKARGAPASTSLPLPSHMALTGSIAGGPAQQAKQPGDQELLELDLSAPDLLPGLNLDPGWLATAAAAGSDKEVDDASDSRAVLRQGALLLDASSAAAGKEYRLAVAGLPLDELEAGSLRGMLTGAVLEADMEARQGRAALSLDSLRYASLAAEKLSSSVRWEGDVVKLEETVVVQQGSRYELAGEVFLPEVLMSQPQGQPQNSSQQPTSQPTVDSNTSTTGTNAHSRRDSNKKASPGSSGLGPDPNKDRHHDTDDPAAAQPGRWRLAVHVPAARLQDVLPATQLFSATQQPGTDYGAAKNSFMSALETARLDAGRLASGAGIVQGLPGTDHALSAATPGSGGAGGGSSAVLPGLQELTGSWSGSIQVWGDVAGASSVEFSLQGRDWRWGAWRLDRVAAVGVADSDEGVMLEELSMAAGPARASLKGALLGSKQDAQLMVKDFPMHMLQPLYSVLPPALQGRGLDAEYRNRGVNPYMKPFAGLVRRLESSMARLSAKLLPGQEELLSTELGSDGSYEDLGPAAPLLGDTPAGPVSGLLFMDGWLGGSPSSPEASLTVNLEQGAVGAVRLKTATGSVVMDEQQRVVASLHLVPQDSEGSLTVQGTAALRSTSKTSASSSAPIDMTSNSKPEAHSSDDDKSAASSPPGRQQSQPEEELDVSFEARNGGMSLLVALVPSCQWQSGTAAVDVRVHGKFAAPSVRGSVRLSHASLTSPLIKHPVSNLAANIEMTGSHVRVHNMDGRVGRSGRIHMAGSLPLLPPPPPGAGSPRVHGHYDSLEDHVYPLQHDELQLVVEGLELRVASTYSGMLDANLQLEGSAMAPSIGGGITVSRGTLNLQPPAATPTTTTPAPTSALGMTQSLASNATDTSQQQASSRPEDLEDAQLVQSAFSLLRAGRKRAALSHANDAAYAVAMGGAGSMSPSTGMPSGGNPSCQLMGLQLVLGPELRATFPVVLNMAVSGQITLHGPADPTQLAASGQILLESGSVNLVATQFVLDREHVNKLLFLPETGLLDPVLDVILVSGELRAVVAGRGSAWQEALSLSAAGTPLSTPLTGGPVPAAGGVAAGSSGSQAGGRKQGADRPSVPAPAAGSALMEPSEVARMFEERLAEALLGENGQIAFRSLASSTLHTLLPKLETRGQLGAARWRLVGAPALPNLLGVLDAAGNATGASDTLDPGKLLSRLAVGTELELMWGNSLTAALQHKLLSESQIGTEARLTYRITKHLRLSLQLQGLTRPSLMLGYTSDAM